jgi:acetylornithine deacetylase/succinyl-diaminopimelate desuccinylase-like protein
LLTALDALRAKRIQINVDLKVFFEGEEEAGSTNLQRTLALHKNLLGADLLITADVPVHPSDGAFLERHRVIRGDFGGSGLVKDRSHRRWQM